MLSLRFGIHSISRRAALKKMGRLLFLFGSGEVVRRIMVRPGLAWASNWAYGYRGCQAAYVTFTSSDPEGIRRIVPEPLQVNTRGILTASFASMHKVWPEHARMSYFVGSLAVPVVYAAQRGFGLQQIEGRFMVNTYTDSPTMASFSRSDWGYPVEQAQFDWSADGGSVRSRVTKGNTEVARIAMSLTDAKGPPPAEMDTYDFNVKRSGPKSELTMTKCRYAEEKLISGTLDDANLFGFEVDQVLDARYRKYDFFIASPEVIRGYPGQ